VDQQQTAEQLTADRCCPGALIGLEVHLRAKKNELRDHAHDDVLLLVPPPPMVAHLYDP